MSTLTTLNTTDNGSTSRNTINSNFTALNTDKLENLVEDTTPQLGGDLDLNGNNIDFPSVPNVSDCLDEDNMASDSATALATQQSIKAYVDNFTGSSNIVTVGTLTSGNVDAAVSAASGTTAGKVELATSTEIDTGTDSTRAIPVDQFVASKRNIRWLVFNLIEASTNVATGTNIGGDFVSPIAGTILQSDTTPFYLYATNSTAGTTGTMVVDIKIGGTSIMTTNKLDFDSTEKTTTTATTPPDLTTTSLAVGDIITIDVVSTHTTPAQGLTVYMAIRES